MTTLHHCQNCDDNVFEQELNAIKNLHQRVMPGEPMPSGECPNCGMLCHPVIFKIKPNFRVLEDMGRSCTFFVLDEERESGNLDREYTRTINAALEFIEQMARFTTPEQEFENPDNKHKKNYADVCEMTADMSDERLCGDHSTFMQMVRQAQTLVTGG